MSQPTWVVLPDKAALAAEAADRFVVTARGAVEERGRFFVALSGGTTPEVVFPLLRSEPWVDRVDWSRVEVFWGDERNVPPDHPESNFGNAYRMLLAHLPSLRPEAIHRMQAESTDLEAAALAYEAELRLAFGTRGDELPAFDLIWLGMGPDGHVASLFPGSKALREMDRWVVPNWAPARRIWRLTLTLPVLNAAREVHFLVSGENKANAVSHIRSGRSRLPAARVHAQRTIWILDRAAAGEAGAAA